MDFSEVYPQSSGSSLKTCKWSPDGRFVAAPVKHRLLIRDASTLQIIKLCTCLDTIDRYFCDSIKFKS